SIDDITATVRFSLSPSGFSAFVISERGSYLVRPLSSNDHQYYLSSFTYDLEPPKLDCLTPAESGSPNPGFEPAATLSDGKLRQYRLAVSVTPEFIFGVGGGTNAGTIAA